MEKISVGFFFLPIFPYDESEDMSSDEDISMT